MLLVLFAGGALAGIIAAYSRNLPDLSRMADYQPDRSTRIYARDGELLATLYKQNRIWEPLSRIPPTVREAFIANEDHTFYTNDGVDFGGIVRASLADLIHHHIEQGASTITQQLARGLFLTDQQTVTRKIQEALLAMEINRYYTKNEILERYLNLIYLGSGAYGVGAAAHTYFARSVTSLTIGQAALLAGLVAAPSDYSPFVSLQLARERERHVLDRMVESGYLTQNQSDAAYNAPLELANQRPAGLEGYRAPWFTTYVIAQLERQFGEQATYEDGLQVDTTVDPRLERLAQSAVDWGVHEGLQEGIGAHEGALVAIRPSTGEILAMVGGTHFSLSNQFNRAWQAHRQPGSSFKLYVYTTAIDSGLAASSLIDDSPISYPNGSGGTWAPQDDDHRFLGPITLREALALSRNVAAVRLLQEVGVDRVIEYAHRMGVRSPLEANLSLALGTSVVSPLDQATGYATIANQGVHIAPTAIRSVDDAFGNPVLDNEYPDQNEVVSAGTAYIVTSMLQDVINHGTGYPNAIIGRPAAGKTGTTSDFRDAWFVGFTPDLVTAVWIGNDDYHPMTESYGGDIPARIWARFMKAALVHVAKHDFVFPGDEVKKVASCEPWHKFDYYLNGTQPATPCGPANLSQAGLYGGVNVANGNASMPPAPTFSPGPTAPPLDATPPPDSVGDGTTYVPLDSPAPSPSVP